MTNSMVTEGTLKCNWFGKQNIFIHNRSKVQAGGGYWQGLQFSLGWATRRSATFRVRLTPPRPTERSQEGTHGLQIGLSCPALCINRETRGCLPTDAPIICMWLMEIAPAYTSHTLLKCILGGGFGSWLGWSGIVCTTNEIASILGHTVSLCSELWYSDLA